MRARVLVLLWQRLLSSYGGVITVDSVEGKGTVFTVDIPMEIVEGQSVDRIQEPHYTADGGGGMGWNGNRGRLDENKECILIIDDNADVRGYVKSLLKEEYTVIEAADGHAGLKAMKYVPDAIICDVDDAGDGRIGMLQEAENGITDFSYSGDVAYCLFFG